jgi:hypothetical protein
MNGCRQSSLKSGIFYGCRVSRKAVAIHSLDPIAMAIYEKNLNAVKGQPENKLNTALVEIRKSWDKDLREKADSVCKNN